jgi:hypothetical protein
VPLEEVLVDRDVLVGNQTGTRLVLTNGIDEHRRVPTEQTREEELWVRVHDQVLRT